ncbi:MAG: transporter substrate-binding domain-containing protein [Microcystaceae cyanobacterium]
MSILLSSFLLLFVLSWLNIFPSQAAEWQTIKKRGKIIIGVKSNTRPLGFQDDQGNLQGLEIDLARQLAEDLLGSKDAVVLVPLTNQERLPALLTDRVDLVIARTTITSGRSRLVDFSPYYYLDGTGIIVRKGNIQHLDDLAQQKIAVLNSSDGIAVIRSRLPAAQLVGVKSYQEALALLATQQVAAFAADNSLLAGWVQEYPDYYLLPIRLSENALAMMMPRGLQYEELRLKVNASLYRWRTNSWLRDRQRHWGLPE